MTQRNVRALGLDPSIRHFGWAVLQGEECIASGQIKPPDRPAAYELAYIYDSMAGLIETYKPDMVGCEDTFVGTNRTTAMRLSEVRAAAMLAIVRHRLPCRLFKPSTLKIMLTGNGRAEKRQMIEAAQARFGLGKISDHEADAIAAALCMLHAPEKGILVA